MIPSTRQISSSPNISSSCESTLIRAPCEYQKNQTSTYLIDYRRVGFAHTEEKSTFILPAAVDELIDHWEISSSDSMAPTYDFLWNATLEEGREKQLISLAFTTSIDEMPPVKDDPVDAVRVAEAALKVR
jgi:hypothetical protein